MTEKKSKGTIWILNHYATSMFLQKGGRHYALSKYLSKQGYKVYVFCAKTVHNSDEVLETNKKIYQLHEDGVTSFVSVETVRAKGNGLRRIANMLVFSRNVVKCSKQVYKDIGKPDIIIGSSVHPFTLWSAKSISKMFNVPFISEIRDLWPESLVAYGYLKKTSILAKLLYWFERRIYIKSNAIVMTWKGGKQYIIDKKWEKDIDINKVYHLSNGVDLEEFLYQKNKEDVVIPECLRDTSTKSFVYTGSIRHVNNLGLLVETAKLIKENQGVNIVVFGDGNEKNELLKRCRENELDNIHFLGKVNKSNIPVLLNYAYANLLHNTSTSLNIYGQSQNKLFEYLASGKCTLQTYKTNYSILLNHNCGMVVDNQTPESIAELILYLSKHEDQVVEMGKWAEKASKKYDYKKIAYEYSRIIEELRRD